MPLAESLRPFVSPDAVRALTASLEAGFALPSAWYTNREVFARERDAILRKGWSYVAHEGELARAGDQVVGKIAGVPIVLVRDEQGVVRGFVNICRHRAHQVVLANQNQRSLQCLYHGWTYGLDGALRAAPRSKTDPDFCAENFPLLPIQVHRWGPTLWANVDLEAPPFETWAKGLEDLLAEQGVDLGDYRYSFEKTWTIGANWKVYLDNSIECYHCATCHPSLAKALEMDPEKQTIAAGGRYWITNTIPMRQTAAQAAPVLYHFHWLFPTTFLQYLSDRRGFDIGSVRVLDVDRIEFRNVFFVRNDMTPEEEARRRAAFEADTVVDEDKAICERVQEAHAAGFVPPGRLLPGSEWLLQHFQQTIVEMMAEPA